MSETNEEVHKSGLVQVEVAETEDIEEHSNEYAVSVWKEVAARLSKTGFAGLVFTVLSGPAAPFVVEAGGAPGPARSVVNPGFRDHLTKVVREVIADRSPNSTQVLMKGADWPPFKLTLAREIGMEDFAPTNARPYIFDGLSVREELETAEKEDNLPTFEPDPAGPPGRVVMVHDDESAREAFGGPEKAPQTAGSPTSIPSTPLAVPPVHKPTRAALERIAREIGELTAEKNEAYGNSVATSAVAMGLLYPNGVQPDQFGDMLTLVRIWDKMKRIATKKDAFGESPFIDIVGYALLGAEKDEADK